jgi:ribosomal protein L29
MKKQSCKEMSSLEVVKLLKEKRNELLNLNVKKNISGVEKPHEIRLCRRLIARLLTRKAQLS